MNIQHRINKYTNRLARLILKSKEKGGLSMSQANRRDELIKTLRENK